MSPKFPIIQFDSIVTLTDYTSEPLVKMGLNAAICYDGKTDEESNKKRSKSCKDKSHLMVARFAYATFNIKQISRVCTHQLVRIAHAGILQESQRYVKHSRVEFVNPGQLYNMSEAFIKRWNDHLLAGELIYEDGIGLGMKKEDARYILSQACTSQVNLCLNFHGWSDFLHNRLSKAAQSEIRAVAVKIKDQLNSISNNYFGE